MDFLNPAAIPAHIVRHYWLELYSIILIRATMNIRKFEFINKLIMDYFLIRFTLPPVVE
jgi:hypothetical protein